MKYEIAYISASGHTERLAYGIADSLPQHKTVITNLAAEEITKKADAYLLGFDIDKGALPLKIMEALEKLEGKTILFFATGGREPLGEYRDTLERMLEPFLPDDCDSRGLFLCPGKFPEKILEAARMKIAEEPDNPTALKIIEDARESEDRPNDRDIEDACRFVRKHLGKG